MVQLLLQAVVPVSPPVVVLVVPVPPTVVAVLGLPPLVVAPAPPKLQWLSAVCCLLV